MASLRRILLVILTALIAVGAAAPAYAVNPHEDPAKAQLAYSAITLFRYYSNTIDSILDRDPDAVDLKLSKMPYANLPESITGATDRFVSSSESCAGLILNIEQGIANLRGLLKQSRLTEVTPLANKILGELTSAYNDVRQMEDSIIFTGATFRVLSEPRTSDLRLAYEGTLRKIGSVRSLLDLDRDLLADLLRGSITSEVIKAVSAGKTQVLPNITTPISVTATELTLTIQPNSAFVGENVTAYGRLTAGSKPLAGRKVDILFNSERYGTVTTDGSGAFTALVTVPYWYAPAIQAQALYYPQTTDVGVYLASLSPTVILSVLYYEANLSLTFEGAAYPGRASTVRGQVAYSPEAAMVARSLEIYLDNALIGQFTASEGFKQSIDLPVDIKVGRHTITVTASADGRYAPALTDVPFDVRKAGVTLNMSFPRVIFVPGRLDLNGGVRSELGPVQDALMKVAAGKNTHEFRTAMDGTFQEKMRLQFEFGLVGAASMDVTIYPGEPWNQPFTISKKIFVINSIMGGGFVLLVVAAAVLLPRRFKLRAAYYRRRRKSLQPAVTGNVPTGPEYSNLVAAPPTGTETDGTAIKVEPRVKIFSWYVLILRLVQRLARVVLKPQQTHREFVGETRKVLGPLADYLMDFTRMVERFLYSRSRATETDVQMSEQLGHRLQDGLKVKQ